MKTLNRFAAWLFLQTGGDDAALGRLAMSKAAPKARTHDPAKRKLAVAQLAQVNASEALQQLLSELMHDQKDFIAMKASADTLYVMRGTMNGIALVKDALAAAASEHEANMKRPKEFNKYEPV